MKKLYVGCSLTHAPSDFRNQVAQLKMILRRDFEVADFIGLETGTPSDVYHWDIHECVAKCDFFVALCDFPAIGLGYELAVAVEKFSKPTLALAHADTHITRLLLGIDHSSFHLVRYNSFDDIPRVIRDFASTV